MSAHTRADNIKHKQNLIICKLPVEGNSTYNSYYQTSGDNYNTNINIGHANLTCLDCSAGLDNIKPRRGIMQMMEIILDFIKQIIVQIWIVNILKLNLDLIIIS